MLAYSKMGRKKGSRKSNTGAKSRAKDRSTAVSQNVKVSIGAARKQPLRGRLGSRPSYTMPAFGGAGGSASVNVTVPHSLPSFDQQVGYSIHTLSSNVDNLVRYLQQTQGAQPIPGPSSESLARSAVLNTTGTQTDVGATAEIGTDPIAFDTGPSVGSASSGVGDPGIDSISNGPRPSELRSVQSTDSAPSTSASQGTTTTDSMLGQSQQGGADPLRFNVGARSRLLPPRTPAVKRKSDGTHEGLTGDVVRSEFPPERGIEQSSIPARSARGVKRKSGGTHEGLTGDVVRSEFPPERGIEQSSIPARSARGVKRKSGGTHEGLTGDVVRSEFPPERGIEQSSIPARSARGVKRKSGGTHEGLTGDVVRSEFPPERGIEQSSIPARSARGVKRKSGGTHEGLTGDVVRSEFPPERRGVKRKSGGTHEGLTGDVGRPEYSVNMRAEAPNGLGPRGLHAFDGLVDKYPFVYPRQHRFSAQEAVPMGGFDFSGNVRPDAKKKREDGDPQGGVQKMQRIGAGRLRF